MSFIERESNNLWTCLTNKACPLKITRQKNKACLCSDSICTRTVCKHIMKTPNGMKKIKCNIKVDTNFWNCLHFPDVQFTGKMINPLRNLLELYLN